MVSSSDLFDDSSPIPKQRLLTKTRVRSNVRGTVLIWKARWHDGFLF